MYCLGNTFIGTRYNPSNSIANCAIAHGIFVQHGTFGTADDVDRKPWTSSG